MENLKANLIDVKNKTALVTGSTRGIGKIIALTLAELGARVFINGRNEKNLLIVKEEFFKNDIIVDGVAGDVTNENFAKRLVEFIIKKTNHLDILVNNVGGTEWHTLEDLNFELWNRDIGRNLTSTFLMCREAAFVMKKQRSGKIINIASTSGMADRVAGAHYIAAKQGIIGFSRAIAKELGQFNIQVNVIAPGLVETDLTRKFYSKDSFDKEAERTPLLRLAAPEDIAKAVIFFASSLSDCITGQTLIVDGGRV